MYKEKGDPVRIEPRPTSPSTCHLCARNWRTLFRLQASGDVTRMQSVLGESRASCRLSIRAGLKLRLTRTAIRGACRQLLTMAHIHRIVRPRCRSESSWLRAGRVWACTRPLHSVYAAAELVCRRRATAAVGRVILLYNRVAYKSFINTSYLNLCVQPLALTILKLGMIEVDVSNRS